MRQLVRDRWSVEAWHWIRDTQLPGDGHRDGAAADGGTEPAEIGGISVDSNRQASWHRNRFTTQSLQCFEPPDRGPAAHLDHSLALPWPQRREPGLANGSRHQPIALGLAHTVKKHFADAIQLLVVGHVCQDVSILDMGDERCCGLDDARM